MVSVVIEDGGCALRLTAKIECYARNIRQPRFESLIITSLLSLKRSLREQRRLF